MIWRSLAFYILKHLISRKFGRVKSINTRQLAQWLENPDSAQPILLDVRTEAEYNLSHLPQAQRLDPYQPHLEQLAEAKDTPIVVYCSVGYRSARIAERLIQAGFSQVYNLQGSIFQWANEGRVVFNFNHRPTQLVHPYNPTWGKLLKPSYRAQIDHCQP